MATIFCENLHRKIVVADDGMNLRDVLLAEGVRISRWPRNYWLLHCRGRGTCTACVVEVTAGADNLGPLTGREQARLGPDPGNRRLCCQCVVRGDVTLRIRP